ncbi:MAG: hypothetical protein ACRDV9_05475, partial [Acidimicrobiia bacterium]
MVPGGIAAADYAVILPVAGLADMDDIAVDPSDGQMYAMANNGGHNDNLVRIDKATGATTDIGVLQAEDVEGLGFASGQFIGTTGRVDKQEGIWDIDKVTGVASNRRPLDNGRDYEGFGCLDPLARPAPAPVACLTVVENAAPDDPEDFPFTAPGGLVPPDFSLDDDGDPTLGNTTTNCNLPAGVYTVIQRPP